MSLKILLAEDEEALSRVFAAALRHKGFEVEQVFDGEEALQTISHHLHDLYILDIMMPKKIGLEVLRELRAKGNRTHTILLTAMGELDDKITGLDAGADDYLTKPISLKELLARVDAIERRLQQYTERRLTIGNVQLHLDQQELVVENSIRLSAYETRLMELLILNKEKDLSTQEIFQQVWGQEKDTDMDEGYVYIYISYLRQKLQAIQAKLKIIGQEGEMFRLVEVQEDA